MAVISGDTAKAVEALQSGQDVKQAVYGEHGGLDSDNVISSDELTVSADTHNSALDAMFGSQDDDSAIDADALSQEDSPNQVDGQSTSDGDVDGDEGTSGDIETLIVSDDKGRRKVEVDFGDREKIKKYVRQAHGMRKFQAERDHARKQLGTVNEQLEGLSTRWKSLEGAYEKDGIKGLVELLDGPDGYDKFEKELLDRHELRRTATPDELELLDARDREIARDRELERIRRENEEFKVKMTEQRERTEIAALESQVHPIYEKYNFTGKLGDTNDESLFNDMLWNSALKQLEPYEEKGLEITREMVDKAFGNTANAIRRRIRSQSEKRVKRTVASKKQHASEVAERTVSKGIKKNSHADEARGLIRDGNISGIFRNWGKYGGLFNK